MRVLRWTHYPPLWDRAASRLGPVTMVVREADLQVPIEQYDVAMPNILTLTDLFEIEGEPTAQEASAEAQRRYARTRQREYHQATQYYWAAAQFKLINPGGTLIMPKPAPLSRLDIEAVFEQLAQHQWYDGHTVQATSQAGEVVRLVAGAVERPIINP